MILFSGYVSLAVVTFMIITSFENKSTLCFLFSLVEGLLSLWDYSFFMSILTFTFFFIQLLILDDLITLTTAVSRGLTIRTMQNIWDHKECFSVRTQGDDG